MAVIDSLLVELGFEYDPKELEGFKKDLDEVVSVTKAVAKVAVAAATAITGLTVASTAASDEQGKLADEIGVTVENLDALQFANRRAGGTAEGMANSLQQLSIRASEAARGVGSGVEAFGLLGISANDAQGNLKPTSQLMLEVSQRFQGLSKARQIELADKLGLRDSIRLLQQGPQEIRNLIGEAKALGTTTAEDAELAAEFQDSLTDLWQITKDVSRTLTRVFVPIMEEMVNTFTEWWKANRDLINQNLPVWIDKLAFAMKLLGLAVAAFIGLKLFALMGSLPTLFMAATVALKGFLAPLFTIPALIGAVIAGVALLAQDAKGFFEGQDSFIGDMIEKYPQWAKEIRVVAALFATIADLTSMVIDGWNELFSFDFSSLDFGQVGNFIMDAVSQGTFTPTPSNVVAPIPTSAGSGGNSMAVDKVEIQVDGAGDPNAVAREVVNQFQQATQDLTSPVDQ